MWQKHSYKSDPYAEVFQKVSSASILCRIFFEVISWPVKYDYVMFSLAISRSEFACSPAKKRLLAKNNQLKAAFSGTKDILTNKQPLRQLKVSAEL